MQEIENMIVKTQFKDVKQQFYFSARKFMFIQRFM